MGNKELFRGLEGSYEVTEITLWGKIAYVISYI
jgi:hypothetical protein